MTIKNLLEEFYDSFKTRYQGYIEVFKNPSTEEMRKVSENGILKFIGTKKPRNTLFVFSPEVMHFTVFDTIKLPGGPFAKGEAFFKNGKYFISKEYSVISKNFKKSHWTWLKKYFDVSELTEEL